LLNRQGKSVISTSAGRGLIHALPDESTYPDMTAHWEFQLQGMAEKTQSYTPFMAELNNRLEQLMQQVKSGPVPDSLKNLPKVERPAFKKRRFSKGKKAPSKTKSRS
jgi:DNA topoisomerase-3